MCMILVYDKLTVHHLKIVERSHIGTDRAYRVLNAYSLNHRTLNGRCQIFGIEITKEPIHIGIVHILLRSLCHSN